MPASSLYDTRLPRHGHPGPVAGPFGPRSVARDHEHRALRDRCRAVAAARAAGAFVQLVAPRGARDAFRASVRSARVCNLSVEGVHTYYVGSGAAAVLVHNCGYKDEAVRGQQRAQELAGRLHLFKESMVTVAVIGVRKRGTKDIVEKVGMSSGQMGDLLKGNPAYEHAEESVFRWLEENPDYEVLYGGTSKNVCSDICAPLVEQSKVKLDGEVFGVAPDKTDLRTFWRLRRQETPAPPPVAPADTQAGRAQLASVRLLRCTAVRSSARVAHRPGPAGNAPPVTGRE